MKGVDVAMKPVADENLKEASAFFVCQVDIVDLSKRALKQISR